MRDKAAKHESTFDVIIQINDRRQHFSKQINTIFPQTTLSITKEVTWYLIISRWPLFTALQNCSNRSSSVTVMTISACNSLCQRQRGEPRGLWDDGGRERAKRAKAKKGWHRPKKHQYWTASSAGVTIYLMPAKLARTSGAGYLVQLFMISSKI